MGAPATANLGGGEMSAKKMLLVTDNPPGAARAKESGLTGLRGSWLVLEDG